MKIYHKPNLVIFSYRRDDITTATLLRTYTNIIQTDFKYQVRLLNKIYNIKIPDNYFNNHDVINFSILLLMLKDYL